jgi:hypothetical protein
LKTLLGQVLENATLYVDVPTTGHTIDSRTGNPVPNQRRLHVQAYLRVLDYPPKQFAQQQPGDKPMLWVEGYVSRVVDASNPSLWLPPELPDRVSEMVRASVGGVAGRLYLIPQVPNAAVQKYVNSMVLGEAIWGWFDASAV